MGGNPDDQHELASQIVSDSLKVALENCKSEECGETAKSLSVTFLLEEKDVDGDIPEEIKENLDVTNDSEHLRDSLENSMSEESLSSRKSSDSSSTSSSSSSSQVQSRPSRLARTFKKGDLANELNSTRVVGKSTKKSIPLIKSGKEIPRFSSRTDSWIKPETIKGTDQDKEKVDQWIVQKNTKMLEDMKRRKTLEKEKIRQSREEEELKSQLQKKNFEQWQDKKKKLLEQKLARSKELKERKKEKEAEKIEKAKYNEKVFQSWKNKKEEHTISEKRLRMLEMQEKKEEDARLKMEKEQNGKKGFDKWCKHQEEIEEKKKAAQRAARDAEVELEILQEYRRREAEEEYINWKEEKRRSQSPEVKKVIHPLGWAPAGKSDGKNRRSPAIRPSSPKEPVSKTLAHLKTGGVTYHRKLKTVDVCCRQISFWCHCTDEDRECEESFRASSPTLSTPDRDRCWTKDSPKDGEYRTYVNDGYEQISRHTTNKSPKASTSKLRIRRNSSSTPKRYS